MISIHFDFYVELKMVKNRAEKGERKEKKRSFSRKYFFRRTFYTFTDNFVKRERTKMVLSATI